MVKPINRLRSIYLDLDGCLVDFVGGALRSLRLDETLQEKVLIFDFFNQFRLDEKQFWSTIANSVEWWASLTPYPWASELYQTCCRYADKVVLCTSHSDCAYAATGKMLWVEKHLGVSPSSVICITEKQRLAAAKGTILIDDSDVNVQQWAEACKLAGRPPYEWAIRFPQPWNKARAFVDRRLAQVQMNLRVHSQRSANEEKSY